MKRFTWAPMLGLVALLVMALSIQACTEAQISESDTTPAKERVVDQSKWEAPADVASKAGAVVITDGSISLGVNPMGSLITGVGGVGVLHNPTGLEALAIAYLGEGWGAADFGSGVQGYDAGFGASNVSPFSFASTATTATSVADVGTLLRVTHDYALSASPDLFRGHVSILNMGGAAADVRYTRVMDWDVQPTPFNEYITIQGTAAEPLALYADNDGFEIPLPLIAKGPLDCFGGGGPIGDFIDYGPCDQGSLFDFGLGLVPAGWAVNFDIFYGASANEADAVAALTAVGANVYSLGQSAASPPDLGEPATFIFGFAAGALDACPGYDLAPDVPTKKLGSNRWIWSGEDPPGSLFTQGRPGGGPFDEIDLEDTGNCSCFNILAMLDDAGYFDYYYVDQYGHFIDEDGNHYDEPQIVEGSYDGHEKMGCSNSVMETWVDYIAGTPIPGPEEKLLEIPEGPASCSNPGVCFGFSACDPERETCSGADLCFTTTEGHGLCAVSISCSGLTACSTSSDCGSGEQCVVESCCGAPVCIPVSATCDAAPGVAAKTIIPELLRSVGPMTGSR